MSAEQTELESEKPHHLDLVRSDGRSESGSLLEFDFVSNLLIGRFCN